MISKRMVCYAYFVLHKVLPGIIYATRMSNSVFPRAGLKCHCCRKGCRLSSKIVLLETVALELVDHSQGSLGPSGPETPKEFGKSLPGPLALGPPECLEKVSKKSRKSVEKVSKRSRKTFSRLFPETSFRFFRGFGPGGPERPL